MGQTFAEEYIKSHFAPRTRNTQLNKRYEVRTSATFESTLTPLLLALGTVLTGQGNPTLFTLLAPVEKIQVPTAYS